MAEYYRQFAFVSSVLAGFALTFYATLLTLGRGSRAATWSALCSVTASVCFLVVTLGTTFTAAKIATLANENEIPAVLVAQRSFISLLFLLGILLLLASFALGGWTRSRRLGIATTIVSALGAVAVFLVLSPFLHVAT